MYEAPLHIFRDTKRYFPGAVFPNAQSFAERILTLPLHEFVAVRDIGVMSSIISQAFNKNH
jgi:dTDP-4-amino-4,6-dideoxygalactose transaminase